ncbi:MAG TPA: hypothetical protein VJR89_00150 [Polyangiales bacterium]|nr:hypothetical protein [Polyangiales bacterium]
MMILAPGIRERLLPPPGGSQRRSQEPQPELVQGVIVNPPRETKVSVRVEIVSEADPQASANAAATPVWPDRPSEPPAAAASEAMLAAVAVEVPQPSAARLGSVDPRRAAAAYFANSDWHPFEQRPAPRLSIRA